MRWQTCRLCVDSKSLVCLLLLIDSLLGQKIPLKKIDSRRKQLLRAGNWNQEHAQAAHNEAPTRFGHSQGYGPPSRNGPSWRGNWPYGPYGPPYSATTTTARSVTYNLSTDSVGSAQVYDFYDLEYMAILTLGTPEQSFQVIPDTGSSNFWVVDSSCRSGRSAACGKERYFQWGQDNKTKVLSRSSASSTYQKEAGSFSIQYGSGSAAGGFGRDQFQFAGLSFPVVFGQATSIGSAFVGTGTVCLGPKNNTTNQDEQDGILGLGWPSLISASGITVLPALSQAMAQGAIASGQFTAFFSSEGDTSCGDSQITMGYFDSENCNASTLSWVSLTSQSYWQFNLNGLSVGSYTYGVTTSAISDTGTSLIYGPALVVENAALQYDKYYQMYIMSCTTTGLPDLNFQINGITFTVTPNRYVFEATDTQCAFALMPMDAEGGVDWILGDTFLRNYCATYDFDNSRLGFSQNFC